MKNTFKHILSKHNKIIDSEILEHYRMDDLEITVKQNKDKIVMWGFNNKTNRFLNLGSKKYEELIKGFQSISTDLYCSGTNYFITLDNNKKKKNSIIYGYCRCSTNELKQDIQRQVRELKLLGAADDTIYLEYESGVKTDRAELNKLLNIVDKGDTIVTTEVSRITRSTKHLCEIIELVQNKHLKLVIGTFIVDCSKGQLDPMTEGMLKMWGVFSEMERNIISARVKSGMANAIAKGKVVGRPKTTTEDIPNVFLRHYPKYKQWVEDKEAGINPKNRRGINITEFARLCEMSRTTIYKYIELVEV